MGFVTIRGNDNYQPNRLTAMRYISLFVLLGILTLASCSGEKTSEPKLLFFIQNGSKLSPEIRVAIDESVIFEGQAKPPPLGRMPAIIFSQRLDLPSGQHVIRFEDRTRGITEDKTFDTPGTRTIFVGIEKGGLTDEHIVFYKELIYPK